MKKLLVIHPFLLAIFPILFLFAYNIDEVPAPDLLLPILVVIAVTLILFFSSRLITKNYIKSGIITSCFLILFFSYGHIWDLIASLELGSFFNEHPGFFLGPLWAVVFVTGAFLVIKSRSNFLTFTKFLNIVSITLVIISLINIGIYEIKMTKLTPAEINKEGDSLDLNDSGNLRDIYYIILDAYAASSTLREIYGYDNSEFIDYLTTKGFYVASRSRSNYMWTHMSIPSSLNMNYVNYSSDIVGIDPGATAIIQEMWQNNEISQLLRSIGYRCMYISDLPYVDIMRGFGYDVISHPWKFFGITLSWFTIKLIETTAGYYFLYPLLQTSRREALLLTFDALVNVPNIKEPTFVFAHISCPHAPFIFDRDGNPAKQDVLSMSGEQMWQNKQGYVDQLIFVNKKVEALVDAILSKSDAAPVIILQADHGPNSAYSSTTPYAELTDMQIHERFNILNAYYLPENGSQLLYESITPVNSFRIVFNLYFGANYELLEDKSYFSHRNQRFKFFLVPPETDSD